MDLEEQYDKIYRYCYAKVRQRELAEDITQETFLRFLESSRYVNTGKALQYLYTIARNLCTDEFRRGKPWPVEAEQGEVQTDDVLTTQITVKMALAALEEADRELLLLRYVNEVPVAVIGRLLGISRFSVYRRVLQAAKKFREALGQEEIV